MISSAVAQHVPACSCLVEFDAAISAARRQVLALSCAIALMEYLASWCEARELERAVLRAEYIAVAMPLGVEREDALRMTADVRGFALHLLVIAPRPSARAIRQVRSSDSHGDRSAWNHEEQEWLVARKSRLREWMVA